MRYAGIEPRAGIAAIAAFLKGEREAPPALDHHQCRFGTWLDSEGHARHGAQPAFQAIKSLHLQIHALAGELLDLQTHNHKQEARARLDKLHDLRDALLEQLKLLARGNR